MPMQAKLLRAIQEKEIERIGAGYPTTVDVRIITASNSNLRTAIKNYKFREDLYYRLNVIPIHLPPLRDRREDIPLLANHFIHKYNREFAKNIKGIKKDALELLKNYDWPGNIRELENLIERLIVLSKQDQIGIDRLPTEIKGEKSSQKDSETEKLYDAVKKFEVEFIRKALNKSGGRKSKTAKMLGIHRNTLSQLEKKLKIDRT